MEAKSFFVREERFSIEIATAPGPVTATILWANCSAGSCQLLSNVTPKTHRQNREMIRPRQSEFVVTVRISLPEARSF